MKTSKIFAMLLSLACATGLVSCEDDSPRQLLNDPTLSHEGTSYNSLSFSWNEIQNAIQYGYRLSDEAGEYALSGVTQDTKVTFTELQPGTTYTLQVWAFAAINGDYSTPPAVTLTATTDGLTKLATPVLTSEDANGNVRFTWEAIEGAEKYYYKVYDSEGEKVASGNTKKTTYTTKGLSSGNYSFTLYAATTVGGYENSDIAKVNFVIEAQEIWRVEGTYNSIELNSSWPATMVAYDNSSYSILAFYGVEGYNADFAVNEANEEDKFSFINGYEFVYSGYKYWILETGREDIDYLYTYPWDNYSYFKGDKNSGEVGFGGYYGTDFDWGYETFTWGESTTDFTIDDLPGSYTNSCYGSAYDYDSNEYKEFDYPNYTATIAKVDDNTVSIDGIYYTQCPVNGKVDISKMAITIAPQVYYDYGDGSLLKFGSATDINGTVTAQINDDGSISIPDFGLWYDWGDGNSVDVYGSADLVKKEAETSSKRKPSPLLTKSAKIVKAVQTKVPAKHPKK